MSQLAYAQCVHLQQVLQRRDIFLLGRPDQVIWAPSKDGSYSVGQGYKEILKRGRVLQSHRAYSFSWNNVVLPNAGNFPWLILRKRVLIGECLSRLGIVVTFNCVLCVLCGDHLESINLLFL